MRRERAVSYRTVLISDLHLGSYRCDAQSVLEFLDSHAAETLYLVGDVIDLWSLRRHAAWRADHLAVIRRIFELARAGTRVIVIPGNHDGPLLHFGALGFEGIEVRQEDILETAGGARYLVAHGHQQDPIFGATNELIGLFCGLGERIGEALHAVRRWAGAEPDASTSWSDFPVWRRPSRFEAALTAAAQTLGVDGVICGHSHAPADRMIGGIHYLNCGDWLRNCTAIVEDWSGNLHLLRRGVSEPTEAPTDTLEQWIGEDAVLAATQ